jgi:mannose-6-phosphate isomerase-like protein (cupin superfamily)
VSTPISTTQAEHYLWGEGCDGWHLLQREEVSVIQERVPAGAGEIRHQHTHARQLFFILEGEGTMELEGQEIRILKGEALEVAPSALHRFFNRSKADVHFLVISTPPAHGDRTNS